MNEKVWDTIFTIILLIFIVGRICNSYIESSINIDVILYLLLGLLIIASISSFIITVQKWCGLRAV